MGDVLSFPRTTETAPEPEPAPIPDADAIMEFESAATRLVDGWGAIDGEEFWSEVKEIQNLIDSWSRG